MRSSRSRLRHHARIGGVDAVDIGVDVAAIGLDGGRERHRARVRAAAPERRDASRLRVEALEAGDHGDFAALLEALDDRAPVDRRDARRAMRAIGGHRELPSLPGARRQPLVLQHQREQARGHLLAGSDDRVIFALIVDGAVARASRRLLHPGDELIRLAGHGRDDDRDLISGVDLAPHMARDIADALEIGDRGAAEFHDETGHGYGRTRRIG